MPEANLYLRTGPFLCEIKTSHERVAEGVALLYDSSVLAERPDFCDFHVSVRSPPLRQRWRPKVSFLLDGMAPFKPSPWGHGLAVLEWGLNWAIATRTYQYLVIHAASLERGGRAIIIPGPPGSGKSTLCAALAMRGWRLLSDELTLVRLDDGCLTALARPISLKNESVSLIRSLAPDCVMSRPVPDTPKGTIAFMKPPPDSLRRIDMTALPAWVVVPRLSPSAPTAMAPRSKPEIFLELAANSLNYSVLGALGFRVLGDLVERSACFDLVYQDLEVATERLTALADGILVG